MASEQDAGVTSASAMRAFADRVGSMREQLRQLVAQLRGDGRRLAAYGATAKGNTVPHPRNYGCFPRKIGRYAIEDRVVSLAQAVRSATGLPADVLRLPERGYLREGYFADVVVFDPATVADRATYEKPHQYAVGVRHVFVNGTAVLKDGEHTGAKPGRALWGPGKAEK